MFASDMTPVASTAIFSISLPELRDVRDYRRLERLVDEDGQDYCISLQRWLLESSGFLRHMWTSERVQGLIGSG